MAAVASFLVFMTLTVWIATAAVEPADRVFMFRWTLLAWLVLATLTVSVHVALPFAGGGDDEAYFQLASRSVASLAQLFDPTRFADESEQSGYPWVLSIVSGLFGNDLLALKFFNLALFMLVGVVWSRIATLLVDADCARRLSVWMTLISPLWFYFFFLLKDIAIVLLESVFLFGLLKVWIGRTARGWLIIMTASLATLMLRAPLLLQYAGIAGASIAVQRLPARKTPGGTVAVAGAIALIAALLALASNEAFLRLLGIYSESRVLGSEAMLEQGLAFGHDSLMQRSIFPFLYLLSETAGFSASTWHSLDALWLRGILALPWIAVIVPLFLVGLPWLWAIPGTTAGSPQSTRGRWFDRRLIATPWSVIAIFIASSMAISWVVGDTTRWRLADMPAITAVAVCASKARPAYVSIIAVTAWLSFVMIGVGLYYFTRSFQLPAA